MSLNLYQCHKCGTADVKPEHTCPATRGKTVYSSTVIRFCDVCGDRLPAGKAFHEWCARSHRAELAEQREQIEEQCRISGDDVLSYIEGAMDLAPWQKDILRQLVEAHREGRQVQLHAHSRRNGQKTLKRHWARIAKLLEDEE